MYLRGSVVPWSQGVILYPCSLYARLLSSVFSSQPFSIFRTWYRNLYTSSVRKIGIFAGTATVPQSRIGQKHNNPEAWTPSWLRSSLVEAQYHHIAPVLTTAPLHQLADLMLLISLRCIHVQAVFKVCSARRPVGWPTEGSRRTNNDHNLYNDWVSWSIISLVTINLSPERDYVYRNNKSLCETTQCMRAPTVNSFNEYLERRLKPVYASLLLLWASGS